jgi:flagellum-specific peptidoglycan hydrolase FlgJ
MTAPARAAAPAARSARSAPYRKNTAPATATAPGTQAQQAFINEIGPGAMAAQQRFGVPASVTIAQAIDESGWGSSQLAAQDHNLFGIKGTGPAGSVTLPTQEYENGQWVTIDAQFRVYHNVSESISDHAELLATSGYYQQAMADRAVPDAFANDLTGVYATDPDYGANLIALMRLYNLYRFDVPATQAQSPAANQPPAHTPAQPAGHTPAPRPSATNASIPGLVPAMSWAPASTAAPAPKLSPASTPASATTPVPATTPAPTTPAPGGTPVRAAGTAAIPGGAELPGTGTATRPAASVPPPVPRSSAAVPRTTTPSGSVRPAAVAPATSAPAGGTARVPGMVASAALYQAALPAVVATAFFAKAKAPLARAEQLHRDVAGQAGLPWQLLAACDWMECQADRRYSPVQGERLGTPTSDGSVYPTKSAALAQCARDMIELCLAVYGLDLTAPGPLSVRAIADAFAAFRWGGLLRRNRVSAMEFPYSVAGLTAAHLKMHWPPIADPDAPDRPGGRFRMPFGALPVVLSLNYPATV